LLSRFNTGHPSGICMSAPGGCPRQLPDPTIVTPAADHWLTQLNYRLGRPVIDLDPTQALASSYTGVVMLRDMAHCLGWPGKPVAIADILALHQDPRGWAACPDAKADWGGLPLISFTDPT